MESAITHYMLCSKRLLLLKNNTPPGLGIPITINNGTTIVIHNLRTI